MFKFIKNLAYNPDKKRIRGSFVTLCSTIALYIAFFYILALVGYDIIIRNNKLGDITTLLLGTFSAMSTAITVIFGVWKTSGSGKKNEQKEEKAE